METRASCFIGTVCLCYGQYNDIFRGLKKDIWPKLEKTSRGGSKTSIKTLLTRVFRSVSSESLNMERKIMRDVGLDNNVSMTVSVTRNERYCVEGHCIPNIAIKLGPGSPNFDREN